MQRHRRRTAGRPVGARAGIARPQLDCDDETWSRYLFFRDNPKGPHAERWRHTFGCGQWFNVQRDTVTHRVTAVFGITERAPEPTTKGEPS